MLDECKEGGERRMSTNKTSEQPLIEVRNLKQYFNINAGFF